MKKLLLFSACIMLAFSSCKKSAPKVTTSNTITVTVGGSDLNFSTAATALLANSSGLHGLLVAGTTGTGSNAQAISIAINSQTPIVKGTYTLNSSTILDATAPLTQIAYVESASTTNPLSFMSDITGTNVSTVTITSISSTNIQGTFSGVLLSDQDFTSTKSITNGKFNVALITHNQ